MADGAAALLIRSAAAAEKLAFKPRARIRAMVNVNDDTRTVIAGCIALGHPLGATGAMMAGTLLDELERRELKLGIVAASGAAGAGTALLIERCE